MSEDCHAKPQAEHEWLQQLVGDWTYESECNMGPEQPPMKNEGSARTRTLGGLWIQSDWIGDTPDGHQHLMCFTVGFDPAKKKFVGSFVASMMTHMWIYEGSLDAARKILTLDTEGPSFAGDGTMAKYQDIVEIRSRDEHTLTSQAIGPDGKWMQFMQATYRRKS